MARKLTILANDVPFSAHPGELLLDAARWFATSGQHERCDDLAPNLASAHFYPGTSEMHDRASASGAQVLW